MLKRTEAVMRRARELYQSGASTRVVGRELGVSFATARNLLLEGGVKLRRPGRRKTRRAERISTDRDLAEKNSPAVLFGHPSGPIAAYDCPIN